MEYDQAEVRVSIQPGDQIRVGRGVVWHHGIYVGDSQVVEFTKRVNPCQVICSHWMEFAAGRELHRVDHAVSLPAEEVVRRAMQSIGHTNYHVWNNNCEHFAAWCKTGRMESSQVQSVKDTVVVVLEAVGQVLTEYGKQIQEKSRKSALMTATVANNQVQGGLAKRDASNPDHG